VGFAVEDIARLGGWADLPFFRTDWPNIDAGLRAETRTILPPPDQRFRALEMLAPRDVRVVILGQDPYPTAGHANGLAFSVSPDVRLPHSLKNIFREIEDDIGVSRENGDLSDWVDHGVLLLNTALSVPEGVKAGHSKLGWSRLTTEVLARLSDHPRAFILWGNHARGFRDHIVGDGHLILESAHPSPLSARRGFFGSRPFSRVNDWQTSRGEAPIRWA